MSPSVLTIIPRYWPAMGGAEQHTRALVQELSSRINCKVATFCGTEPVATDHAFAFAEHRNMLDGSVPIEQLAANGVSKPILKALGRAAGGSRVVDRLFRTAVKRPLRSALKDLVADADIVHCVYNGFTPAAEVAATFDKPFVWTPLAHTTLPAGTAWSSSGFQKLYQRADALIAMTEYEQAWLAQMGANQDKVHVAPMAPLLPEIKSDPESFKRAFEITESQMVLFLGRVTEAKGARILIEAADQIWASNPDTAIVLAGPYEDSLLSNWLQSTDPRLKICGALGEADKQAALQACDLVCVPSAEESLGVVYLEAWAFAKPVVAADIPVLRTVISDQKDGLLIDRTPFAVATAVTKLLADPAHAARMGQSGKAKTDRNYNWASTAETLLEIYDQVLAN